MREPEERPGLPLWLPEPYHGPRPPEGYPLPTKPKKKSATQRAAGKRPSQHASQRPAAMVRVATVIVSAMFAIVIIMITIIIIRR